MRKRKIYLTFCPFQCIFYTGYLFNQSICVESGFGFYAVASENFEKAMKNPLFRAYHEEAAGIAQGRFLKVQNASGENQKFILVLTL